MASPIKADCSHKYRAVHNSGKRNISAIKFIIIHDEEASTAESAASWFENPESQGSAHLCIDKDICYRTLENDEVPWAAASSFGANTSGFHIELAGFANWSTALWKQHVMTLRRGAYKTAWHCSLFNLPVVWLDARGLLNGRKGISSHRAVSNASKMQDPTHAFAYSHSDPGPFFPRRLFMKYVHEYYNEIKGIQT